MPTLRSELSKIDLSGLRFDDEEDTPQQTTATNGTQVANIARQMFDYLRANPWKTSKEIADALGLTGRNASSRVLQMHQRGNLSRRVQEDGTIRYATNAGEYLALSRDEVLARANAARSAAAAKRKAQAARRAAKKAKAAAAAVPDLKPAVKPVQAEPAAPVVNSVDDLLNALSVKAARELYLKLKEMFGG